MMFRPLHAGSLELFPFFGGGHFLGRPVVPGPSCCAAAVISPPLHGLAVFSDMPHRVAISGQDEPRS
jgi:hypothetical protein